ncbi:30S ribosomal protein S7 [Patescibacteria group bacterium]|nr:30S ribosomal protein S7 [Patescibacteria group bacterium]MBU1256072.1 30S ribosomal protein S7 [Patescibacteria group bacterium]MBU1457602.1 30S ribosomal protein S7 [Patescibacteria group bacterium]
MRTKKAPKRKIINDFVYDSPLVAKIINSCMYDGKKTIAQKHVYDALQIIKEKTKKDELQILTEAMENISPQMEVRSRRVGGASYQVPMSIRSERKQALAIRWLVQAARQKSNSEFHTFAEKLAAEILDAHNNQGVTIKKKLDTQKMAEANRAFAHFRW